MELERIQAALDMAEGVISQAARMLTLKRTTLIEKMRKYRVGRGYDGKADCLPVRVKEGNPRL